MRTSLSAVLFCVGLLLTSCDPVPPSYGPANMGGPSVAVRKAQIAAEQSGDYFIGRRYYVNRTWWWGYLRRPGQPWSKAQLVVFNQRRKRAPDHLPQDGPVGAHHAYDHNYEYRIWGRFTGEEVYEPNSNQFLPEFELSNYELISRNPGWIFYPSDHYDPYRLTLRP